MIPRSILLGLAAALVLVVGLVVEFIWTAPVRDALRVYTQIVAAANRQDQQAAAGLFSARYLRAHPPEVASEGGLVGLPRNLPHKNFRAWRDGSNVLICPANRVGPVFLFVQENGAWRFDGPVGLLRPGGELIPLNEDGAPGP